MATVLRVVAVVSAWWRVGAMSRGAAGLSVALRGGSSTTTAAAASEEDEAAAKSKAIPCIDVSRIMAGCPSEADVAAVGAACREFGFFNVVNHGIPAEVVARLDEAMARFFGKPSDEKERVARTATNSRGFSANEFTKQTRDVKELYDYGHVPDRSKEPDDPANLVMDGHNQLPRDDPEFGEALETYYQACARVCAALVRCVARALDLEDAAFDDYLGDRHTSYLRLNYYPPLAPSATRFADARADLDRLRHNLTDDADTRLAALDGPRLGVNRHFDAGVLTLLRQDDDVPGLQMNYRAHDDGPPLWIDVVPVRGGLTVNCGDMLQVLSNDRFKAPEHRVLASPPAAVRYSAPFFYNPAYDALIRPHAAHPNYEPFTYGYFRKRRFQGDFEDQGTPEIQIAHYRRRPPLPADSEDAPVFQPPAPA